MAEHRIQGKHGEHVYRLKFTEEPDEREAAIVGDFLGNVRAALDYLMVGLVPSDRQCKTHFPIFKSDPFRMDPDHLGEYLERSATNRAKWEADTQGLEADPLRIIKEFQPFNTPRGTGKPHALAVLQGFSNANKHRHPVVVPLGLKSAQLYVNGEASDTISVFEPRVVKAGDALFRSDVAADVEIEGTPGVLIRIRRVHGAPEVAGGSLGAMLLFVRGVLVGTLAPYLQR